MLVNMNFNVTAVLSDAGYSDGGDNGFFKQFGKRDVRRHNNGFFHGYHRGPKANENWRFHAIILSDFCFDLHIDFGHEYGHGYINEHNTIEKEAKRIRSS